MAAGRQWCAALRLCQTDPGKGVDFFLQPDRRRDRRLPLHLHADGGMLIILADKWPRTSGHGQGCHDFVLQCGVVWCGVCVVCVCLCVFVCVCVSVCAEDVRGPAAGTPTPSFS